MSATIIRLPIVARPIPVTAHPMWRLGVTEAFAAQIVETHGTPREAARQRAGELLDRMLPADGWPHSEGEI